MLRIILSGCNGQMGRVIARTTRRRDDMTVVAGIDANTEITEGFHVFPRPSECGDVAADVIVDFSHPTLTMEVLDYAVSRQLPLVVATTGLGKDQIGRIHEAARIIPVFFTANMSLGVNLMVELCRTASRILYGDFDIEIIEKHHNQKIDAPSGTALMLANAITEELPDEMVYRYDRQSIRQKRAKEEIGILSMRGGTIAGEHEVYFTGQDEVLSISHRATSKEVFAVGSLNAARFLACKPHGLYTMADLIQQG